MKTKTVWIIGAILFCAVAKSAIVTLLVLSVILTPVVGKVLEFSARADDPNYRNKHN